MMPVPFPTAVINPDVDTVATLEIAEDHVTTLFVAFDGAIVAIALKVAPFSSAILPVFNVTL